MPRLLLVRQIVVRLLLAVAVFTAPVWATASTYDPDGLSGRLNRTVAEASFATIDWQIGAIVRGVGDLLGLPLTGKAATPPPDSVEARDLVKRYFELGAEERALRAEIEAVWSRRAEADREQRVDDLSIRAAAIAEERRAIEPTVRDVLAAQLSEELWREGFNRDLVALDVLSGQGLLAVDVTPRVWFEITTLPQVLIVAPRDEIRVIESRLIEPQADLTKVEELEARVDRLGVSSILTPIGGLAVYPSMIPNTMDLRSTLVTIAHEWVHHYLFVRPLGTRYFADYRLRAINETAADIAGRELGEKVYRHYYAEDATPTSSASSPPRSHDNRPDFGTLMRDVRREVERLLAEGKVEEAERYMDEQRQVLVGHGYVVRKINTAYLALFGSYVGGGNPDEPALHELRESAGSLKEFLDLVGGIGDIVAFDHLVAATDDR